MRRTSMIGLLALAALTALTTAPAAQARTKVVYAGPSSRAGLSPLTDLNAFYRRNVTINAGDSVRWQIRGFHNVTLGRPIPPLAGPDFTRPLAGYSDAAGAAYWFNGAPSLKVPSSVISRTGSSTVTGSEYHTSGLPVPKPTPYTLKFTKTGTYRYLCTVHPGMTGTVRVVRRGTSVPTALSDALAGASERAAGVRLVQRQSRYAPRNFVAAGHDSGPATLLRFFPRVKTIRAGQSVRFSIVSKTEIHTITFGPAAVRSSLEQNLFKVTPPAGPGQRPTFDFNPLAFLPSDRLPLPAYTGTNHGNGFFNSGQLDTDRRSPYPPSVTIRFPNRGSFLYVCVIHPGMAGVVRVA